MGLVAVTIFPGAEFAVKGGKGRIRSWAEAQASLLKGLVSWINRQEQRSANGARSQKVMVLKKILQLKRRVQAAVDMSHDTWHGITINVEFSSGAQRVCELFVVLVYPRKQQHLLCWTRGSPKQRPLHLSPQKRFLGSWSLRLPMKLALCWKQNQVLRWSSRFSMKLPLHWLQTFYRLWIPV